MIFVDNSQQFLFTCWTIVHNAVFVTVLIMNTVCEFLRIHGLKFGFCQYIGSRRFRTIHTVVHQSTEVLHLVQFGIFAWFQNVGYHIGISFFIYLCIRHQFLKQFHCFRHILIQSRQYNIGTFVARRYAEVTCQAIEFAFYLLRCHIGGSQIVNVIESGTEGFIIIIAHVEYINQLEQVITCVLFV